MGYQLFLEISAVVTSLVTRTSVLILSAVFGSTVAQLSGRRAVPWRLRGRCRGFSRYLMMARDIGEQSRRIGRDNCHQAIARRRMRASIRASGRIDPCRDGRCARRGGWSWSAADFTPFRA